MIITPFETISHYRLIRKLGTGGMGEVFLAEDIQLKRNVALKLLKTASVKDERSRKRLIREAQTAATLDHPNICAIYEVGRDQEQSFIAMQYVEGETLANRIRSGALTLIQSLDLAIEIAGALSEAHSFKIIHRDIKPQNIMITARGQAKLMDFGLASLMPQKLSIQSECETATLLTDPGSVVGTVPYMSPEQLRGEMLDGRSDIFSFGTVMYQMTTGRQPFAAQSYAETVTAILTRDPAPLTRYVGDAPGELQRIITKTLAKNRDKRYQTAEDLLIDLQLLKEGLQREPKQGLWSSSEHPVSTQAAIENERVSAGTGNQVSAIRSWQHRLIFNLKRHWSVALGVAAILLLVILALMRPPGTTAGIDSLAILPYSNASENPNVTYLSDGIAEGLIINLSQLPQLKVMSRTSSFRYRPPELSPSEIGRRLKVKAVAIVRVRQINDNVTISLELVDAIDDHQIWGAQYDRKFSDILAVQAEMSQLISEKLRLRLAPEEQKQITRRYTDNPEAYRLYLQGRFYYYKLTEEAVNRSIVYYKRAVAEDPNYAPAYAALSVAYITLGFNYVLPRQVMEDARAYATRAIELDNALAEAHLSLADIKYGYDWDWAAAEHEYKRALDLDPNCAPAYAGYGWLLETMNRVPEAISLTQRAVALDALSVIAHNNLAEAYRLDGQYDQAITEYRKTLDLDSSFYYANLSIANTYALRGMRDEALAELSVMTALPTDNLLARAYLAQIYARVGRATEARRILNSLIEAPTQQYVNRYEVASICAALDRKEEALEWLERSFQDRSVLILRLQRDPQFNGLHDDQRFKDLLKRIRLP